MRGITICPSIPDTIIVAYMFLSPSMVEVIVWQPDEPRNRNETDNFQSAMLSCLDRPRPGQPSRRGCVRHHLIPIVHLSNRVLNKSCLLTAKSLMLSITYCANRAPTSATPVRE